MLLYPAQMAEAIEMPFGMWAQVGPSIRWGSRSSGGRAVLEMGMPTVDVFDKTILSFIEILQSDVTR